MASPVRGGGLGELAKLRKLGGRRGAGVVGGRSIWPATIVVEEWLG